MNPIHFSGINIIQDKIKDKLGEQQIYEGFDGQYDNEKQLIKQDVKNLIIKEDNKIKRPKYTQRILDSFYFSTITACLLGYGDIYPITNISKILVSFQGLFTVSLILY